MCISTYSYDHTYPCPCCMCSLFWAHLVAQHFLSHETVATLPCRRGSLFSRDRTIHGLRWSKHLGGVFPKLKRHRNLRMMSLCRVCIQIRFQTMAFKGYSSCMNSNFRSALVFHHVSSWTIWIFKMLICSRIYWSTLGYAVVPQLVDQQFPEVGDQHDGMPLRTVIG